MALFKPAVRARIKLRAALDGPTGAGKTWTALQLARIIAGPSGNIGIIDTESESALRYALAPGETATRTNFWDPPYEFGHLPQDPPYSPVTLGNMIDAAGEELGPDGVLIIDSLTHYWTGEGGTLDIVDDAERRGANRFTAWAEGTPAQRYMLDKMIRAKCHLVVCMRSKMEYALEQTNDGDGRRSRVRKIGMAPEQRGGIEYEFDLVASMDVENRLLVTKSRIPGLAKMSKDAGRSHELGAALVDWLATGAERITDATWQSIVDMLNSFGPEGDDGKAERAHIKNEFLAQFGTPDRILASQVEAIYEWIGARQPAENTAAADEPEPDPSSEAAEPEVEAAADKPKRSRKKADDTEPDDGPGFDGLEQDPMDAPAAAGHS